MHRGRHRRLLVRHRLEAVPLATPSRTRLRRSTTGATAKQADRLHYDAIENPMQRRSPKPFTTISHSIARASLASHSHAKASREAASIVHVASRCLVLVADHRGRSRRGHHRCLYPTLPNIHSEGCGHLLERRTLLEDRRESARRRTIRRGGELSRDDASVRAGKGSSSNR